MGREWTAFYFVLIAKLHSGLYAVFRYGGRTTLPTCTPLTRLRSWALCLYWVIKKTRAVEMDQAVLNKCERRGASPIPLTLENTIAGEYRHASPTEPNELKKHEEFRRITISKETTKRLQY